MAKRYIVLGAKGQLGQALSRRLKSEGSDVVEADREECDIADGSSVVSFIERHQAAEALFNAAAFTAVDNAEEKADQAMAINGIGAGYVAAACASHQVRLIHFSTDFVFGDGHVEPIDELAKPEPLSVYGESKWAGEKLALQNCDATAVIRSSGLYSAWGENFVRSIAHYAREKGEIEVVADQVVGPTPVTRLAEVAVALATERLFVGGVYHGTAQGNCSWYEFAKAIVETLGIEAAVKKTTAEAWGAPARRPEYSVLENRRLRAMGLDFFEHWRDHLEEFLEENQELFR